MKYSIELNCVINHIRALCVYTAQTKYLSNIPLQFDMEPTSCGR